MKKRKASNFTGCEEKHVHLLLIEQEGKRHHALIEAFNTFMYDHTLGRERKHFCRCCLQAFRTEEILKRHIKYCFKINGKQKIALPKKAIIINSNIKREKQSHHI